MKFSQLKKYFHKMEDVQELHWGTNSAYQKLNER